MTEIKKETEAKAKKETKTEAVKKDIPVAITGENVYERLTVHKDEEPEGEEWREVGAITTPKEWREGILRITPPVIEVEALTVIEAWGLGYHLGKVLEHIEASGKPGVDTIKEMEQAARYLDRQIKMLRHQ